MSVPSWARVGAKVVCLGCAPHKHPYFDPQAGEVFTIQALLEWEYVGVKLVEMTNRDGYGPWWDLVHFRPVVETKSDDEVEAQLYHKKGLHHTTRKRVDA
jgi:hypothetical protein